MARGYCVDCHYEGPLNPMGDCPRCGSDWTDSVADATRRDEDQLDGLLNASYSSRTTSEDQDSDYYEL